MNEPDRDENARRHDWPRVEFRCAAVVAVWTGFSTVFTVGAGVENPGSFAFSLFAGGTIVSLLLFVLLVARGLVGE